MPILSVNIDHVATLRQARGTRYPDPVAAASICELAGADGITTHLREDRRHIIDRDVEILRQTVQTPFNLEMAATDEMLDIACRIKPNLVTLVPEKREERTTEGGLDVKGQVRRISDAIEQLTKSGITASIFINPDRDQITAARETGAPFIEIHTGRYADATSPAEADREYGLIVGAVQHAHSLGLRTNGGHGLHYHNVRRIALIPGIEGLYIGHGIISRAVFVGLERAVREMADLVHV